MANARKPTRVKEKRTAKVHNYRLLQVLSRQFPTLTQTERIVCDLLAMHLRTKEIAEKMGIGARTVETHRQNIRRKLGVPKGKELSAFLCSI